MKIKIRDQRGKEAEYSIPLGMEVCGLDVTGWQDLCIIMDAAQRFVCSHMEEMAYDKNGIATESELETVANSSLAHPPITGCPVLVSSSGGVIRCGCPVTEQDIYCDYHMLKPPTI